jgi:hypothetical protein
MSWTSTRGGLQRRMRALSSKSEISVDWDSRGSSLCSIPVLIPSATSSDETTLNERLLHSYLERLMKKPMKNEKKRTPDTRVASVFCLSKKVLLCKFFLVFFRTSKVGVVFSVALCFFIFVCLEATLRAAERTLAHVAVRSHLSPRWGQRGREPFAGLHGDGRGRLCERSSFAEPRRFAGGFLFLFLFILFRCAGGSPRWGSRGSGR